MMDHPDVTHAERTGYPKGGKLNLWIGRVYVIATFDVSIGPEEECCDAETAMAEARRGVLLAIKTASLDHAHSRESINELVDLTEVEAATAIPTEENEDG